MNSDSGHYSIIAGRSGLAVAYLTAVRAAYLLYCDIVAKLHGIGKGTVIKKLKEGHTLDRLGNLDSSVDEAVKEATKFIGACYSSISKDDLSEIRVETWSKKMGKKNITTAPELERSRSIRSRFMVHTQVLNVCTKFEADIAVFVQKL